MEHKNLCWDRQSLTVEDLGPVVGVAAGDEERVVVEHDGPGEGPRAHEDALQVLPAVRQGHVLPAVAGVGLREAEEEVD